MRLMRLGRAAAALAAVAATVLLLTGCGTGPAYDNDSPPGYVVDDAYMA